MPGRRASRRRGQRRSARQIFRETGVVSIKAQESFICGADGLEVPSDRSFTALSISLQLTANAPIIVQTELWGAGSRPVWRSQPTSVGLIPLRRTYRWPTRASAMWPSSSKDTIFKIVCPCPGKIFQSSYVSVTYTVTCQLSSDYDQQLCPKSHGRIERLPSAEPVSDFEEIPVYAASTMVRGDGIGETH